MADRIVPGPPQPVPRSALPAFAALAGERAGYNALEGTFLGGCLVSGRGAGRDLTHRL